MRVLQSVAVQKKRGITLISSLSTRNDVFSETSGSKGDASKATADIGFSVKSISARFFNIYYKQTQQPSFSRLLFEYRWATTVLDAEPVLENTLSIKPNTLESDIMAGDISSTSELPLLPKSIS